MPSLTINNIPNDLYQELKLAAERHHRSLNREVIVCLKRSLQPVRSNPEDRLKDTRKLRSQIQPDVVTVEETNRAINEGRP